MVTCIVQAATFRGVLSAADDEEEEVTLALWQGVVPDHLEMTAWKADRLLNSGTFCLRAKAASTATIGTR